MAKRLVLAAIAVAGVFLLSSPLGAVTIGSGSTATVIINISGEFVSSFQLTVTCDESVAVFGDPMVGSIQGFTIDAIKTGPGSISISGFGADTSTSVGVVATVPISAVGAAGSSTAITGKGTFYDMMGGYTYGMVLCSPDSLIIQGVPGAITGFTTDQWDLTLSDVPGGNQVTVSGIVTNTGTGTATYRGTLAINGIERDIEEVSLAGGESKPVSFSALVSEPGDYTATIGETTLSFSVPEGTGQGGGLSGLLLLGIAVGAGLAVAAPVTTLVIRRRRRAFSMPSRASEPEPTEPVFRPLEPALESPPGPAEAEPNRVEYDLGGGILTVTGEAARHLREAIRTKAADPTCAIRIIRSPAVPTQLKLVIDSQQPTDTVFPSQGMKMLLLGPDVIKMLEGVTIDFHESEHGGTFALSRGQPRG